MINIQMMELNLIINWKKLMIWILIIIVAINIESEYKKFFKVQYLFNHYDNKNMKLRILSK